MTAFRVCAHVARSLARPIRRTPHQSLCDMLFFAHGPAWRVRPSLPLVRACAGAPAVNCAALPNRRALLRHVDSASATPWDTRGRCRARISRAWAGACFAPCGRGGFRSPPRAFALLGTAWHCCVCSDCEIGACARETCGDVPRSTLAPPSATSGSTVLQGDALVALGVAPDAIIARDNSSLIFAKRVVWPAPALLHRMCDR